MLFHLLPEIILCITGCVICRQVQNENVGPHVEKSRKIVPTVVLKHKALCFLPQSPHHLPHYFWLLFPSAGNQAQGCHGACAEGAGGVAPPTARPGLCGRGLASASRPCCLQLGPHGRAPPACAGGLSPRGATRGVGSGGPGWLSQWPLVGRGGGEAGVPRGQPRWGPQPCPGEVEEAALCELRPGVAHPRRIGLHLETQIQRGDY